MRWVIPFPPRSATVRCPHSPLILGHQLGVLLTEDRPNWGWGAKEPVPMFTEAEIRAACDDLGLLDIDTDSVIEQLKENRQR